MPSRQQPDVANARAATGGGGYVGDSRSIYGEAPPLPEIDPALANTYWGQLIASDWGNLKGSYTGGKEAPKPGQLHGATAEIVYRTGGAHVSEQHAEELAKQGWTYGQPAPKHFHYNAQGLLERDGPTMLGDFARGAAGVGALTATALTAGATSPLAAAAVGGATSLASTKLAGGSWRQALIAGGLGAASAGIGASNIGSTPTRVAAQAGIGAAQSANAGGGLRGALVGAAQGGANAAASTPDPTGVRADVANVANRVTGGAMSQPTLQQTLINTALATAAGGASGGVYGALLAGAGAGVAGATAGSTNPTVQAVGAAAPTLASRIMSGVQAGGQAAGNLASAREAGRQVEAGNIVTQDQQRLSAEQVAQNAHRDRADVDLKRREETRTSQNDAFKNALRSALALNTRDVSVNRPEGVPTISFSGGSRPSAIGEQGRQAAGLVNQRALDTLMNPNEDFYDLPDVETFQPNALPKANGVDTALGVAGGVASVLQSLQQQGQAGQQASLIQQLIQRSQQDANAGLTAPAAAAPPPTVQSQVNDVSRRVAGIYDDEPWLGGGA